MVTMRPLRLQDDYVHEERKFGSFRLALPQLEIKKHLGVLEDPLDVPLPPEPWQALHEMFLSVVLVLLVSSPRRKHACIVGELRLSNLSFTSNFHTQQIFQNKLSFWLSCFFPQTGTTPRKCQGAFPPSVKHFYLLNFPSLKMTKFKELATL